MIRACPNPQEQCPYFDREPPRQLREQEYGCFSDRHHIFWRSLMETLLEKTYSDLPENSIQPCRWEHDEIHAGPPPELPSLQEMLAAVSAATITESRRRRIFNS